LLQYSGEAAERYTPNERRHCDDAGGRPQCALTVRGRVQGCCSQRNTISEVDDRQGGTLTRFL
jgi:hypothetical protein